MNNAHIGLYLFLPCPKEGFSIVCLRVMLSFAPSSNTKGHYNYSPTPNFRVSGHLHIRSAAQDPPRRRPPEARHSPSFRCQFAPPSEPITPVHWLLWSPRLPTRSPRQLALTAAPSHTQLSTSRAEREVHPPTRSSRSTMCYNIDAISRFYSYDPACPFISRLRRNALTDRHEIW